MSFSLQSFLRRTPTENLETYFKSKQPTGADDIDWTAEARVLQASLVGAVRSLSQDARESNLADFKEVDQLCDEFGRRALRSLAGVANIALDKMDGDEARGLFMLVTQPREFRRALSIAYSERPTMVGPGVVSTFRTGDNRLINQTCSVGLKTASGICSLNSTARAARCWSKALSGQVRRECWSSTQFLSNRPR